MADEVKKVALTVGVVTSFVGKNHVRPADVPELLASIHAAISALDQPAAPEQEEAPAEQEHKPAVTVRKSLASPEHIISMIDGKAYKTLKRHLGRHGLTPDAYRQRYGLKKDYPMVASAYSEARRVTAKALGLGRKAVAKIEEVVSIEPAGAPEKMARKKASSASNTAAAPKRRGRKPKTSEATPSTVE